MRRIGLFLAMTVCPAVAAVVGGLGLGREFDSHAGFFGSAAAAGAVAVLLVGKLLAWRNIVPRRRYRSVSVGALVGLGYAIGVSVFTAMLIIIPLSSFVLVGAGAVIGDVEAAHGERQASSRRAT